MGRIATCLVLSVLLTVPSPAAGVAGGGVSDAFDDLSTSSSGGDLLGGGEVGGGSFDCIDAPVGSSCGGGTVIGGGFLAAGWDPGNPECAHIFSGSNDEGDSLATCWTGSGDPGPPPSHGQIVATLCPDSSLPDPPLHIRPPNRGITGLESPFWSDPLPPLAASGVVAGYAVSCVATPTEWTFDPADPDWGGHPVTVDDPGSRDAPALAHMWEVRGVYPIAVTLTWERVTPAATDRPQTSTGRDYQVNEIVTVPADPSTG